MLANDANQPVVLQLKLEPPWVYVDEIRRFVESFCAAACPGLERESELALATHELVQNAIANGEAPGVEITLSVDRAHDRVEVAVTNFTSPERARTLEEKLGQLYAFRDPLSGYMAAMGENPRGRGGLGLARIRFEADLDLAAETKGERLTVRATGPLKTRFKLAS